MLRFLSFCFFFKKKGVQNSLAFKALKVKKGKKETYQHGNLFPQRGMSLRLVPRHQTCLMGPKESLLCYCAQSRAGKSRPLQQTVFNFKLMLFVNTKLVKLQVANCVWFSHPHMTAALCAGCNQPCTCRPWWSGRWAGTAGSSLHCCDCTDWCLGTQKHTRSTIKGGSQKQKQMFPE